MSTTKTRLALVRKVIALERRKGYADTAALGGLEKFILLHLPEGAELVAGYADMDHSARELALQRLEEVIDSLEKAFVIQDIDALRRPVEQAVGVGKKAQFLRRLGIETIEDLLTFFPRRLEDRSLRKPIAKVADGESVTIQGVVRAKSRIRVRSGLELIKVAVDDGSGLLFAIWFNQPWLWNEIQERQEYAFYGKVQRRYGEIQMENPVWEPAGTDFHTGRWVPIYPATEGLTQTGIRWLIQRNLRRHKPTIFEVVPEEIRQKLSLLPRQEAIAKIHFPENPDDFERARKTLAFEELFLLELGIAMRRNRIRPQGRAITPNPDLVRRFLDQLPFSLTPSQRRALEAIEKDLSAPYPMLRLLQGDVGSGKTVVAATACVMVTSSGAQAAIMAPTEILAEQHYMVFQDLLRGLPVRVALLVGGRKKEDIISAIAQGDVDIVVGTHALIEEDVRFRDLGLAVVDEQHRFGVVQRAALEQKGVGTNILVMSATPIPRTLVLTLYGEFAVSVLKEMPIPKRNVRTVWVSESRRAEVYQEVERLLTQGEKGYVVFPLVEESEELDLRAAVQAHAELENRFSRFGVGLIHGRMPPEEKRKVMSAFRTGEVRVLVATTVVELGLDVPDANFCVIEHADRFGLAQLHQLRGRIGRAGQPSFCFAIADPTTDEARARLSAFRDLSDGFKIAEADLRIRGPGDLLGTAQHGFVSRLRAADLVRDLWLLERARCEAFQLARRGVPAALRYEVERRFGEALDLLGV